MTLNVTSAYHESHFESQPGGLLQAETQFRVEEGPAQGALLAGDVANHEIVGPGIAHLDERLQGGGVVARFKRQLRQAADKNRPGARRKPPRRR